ncbi:unnamed protein product [Brachionus calyciflorus]|uniref:Uncharacterized protein n=1 Tax=Brachionus calyciflorus TaxID=104777 RepID=A0A814DDW6_9BILA|nr:unnamed protein product [Brachionus calyciflorus]
MNQIRSDILEYYSNLENEIDIVSEKAIAYFKTEDTVNKINCGRDKLIAKIKETEKLKLNTLKDSQSIYDGIFCFFIPISDFSYMDSKSDSESEEVEEDDDEPDEWDEQDDKKRFLKWKNRFLNKLLRERKGEFEFPNQIGQLLVTNCTLNNDIVEKLIGLDDLDEIEFETFEESAKFNIFFQLIQAKNDIIIDLTQLENNQIARLNLNGDCGGLNEKSLTFIDTCLNVQSIKELRLKNALIYELPNNFFQSFKHLTKLNLHLNYLKSFNDDVFNDLQNLESLKLTNLSFAKWEANTFKKLTKLNELVLDRVSIKGSDILNNLDHLKKLVLKECSIIDFEIKNSDCLKSLESFKFLENGFDEMYKTDKFKGLNNLKSFESDCDVDKFQINPGLEILGLKFQTIKSLNNFKMLKFLNIREHCSFKNINFLNELKELEYLDFKLPNNLTYAFKFVNLPKLKFLVLTCTNTPNFRDSFKNLQGLELIEPKFIPRDHFVNLISLDYLAITDPTVSMFNTFIKTSLPTLKQMKYLKIESDILEIHNETKQENIKQALLKLFQEPDKVICKNSFNYDFAIEMSSKLDDEEISEKVYFEKYLQVSECVREFILDNQSNYFSECFRNTERRKSNFVLDSESSDEEDDDSDEHDDDCDCYECNDYCGSFSGYDSDDKYMLGFGTYGTTWNEWAE